MSKKEKFGFCLDIDQHHYFFPIAQIENKKSGEHYLIPNNPYGNHFSFHKSGKIHFKDLKNDKIIPILKSDITDPIEESIDNVKDVFQIIKEDKNDPDLQKALLFILKFLDCIQFGCENAKCLNIKGISFNIDSLIELFLDYSNNEGMSVIDNDDEEDEINNDEETTFYPEFRSLNTSL